MNLKDLKLGQTVLADSLHGAPNFLDYASKDVAEVNKKLKLFYKQSDASKKKALKQEIKNMVKALEKEHGIRYFDLDELFEN